MTVIFGKEVTVQAHFKVSYAEWWKLKSWLEQSYSDALDGADDDTVAPLEALLTSMGIPLEEEDWLEETRTPNRQDLKEEDGPPLTIARDRERGEHA
jgi:hypothetical protein